MHAASMANIAGLEERLRNIEEGLTVHDDCLSATSYRSKGMARAGAIMTTMSYAILLFQFCPWWLIMVCCAPKDALPNGRYNPRAALATVVVDGGSALNALAIALFVHYGMGRTELLPIMVGYVVWFSGFTALACISVWDKLYAGEDWPAAQNAHNARLFRTFGIVVRTVTNDDVTFPLYFLVSIMPAFTAAFLVYWRSIPRFTVNCNESWTENMPGILKGSCDSELAQMNGGGCCMIVDERFDYFYFTGFLAGNIVAGYQAVKLGANCLLAHAETKGFVSGGVASVATEDDPLRVTHSKDASDTGSVTKSGVRNFTETMQDFSSASEFSRAAVDACVDKEDGFVQRFNKAKKAIGKATKVVASSRLSRGASLGQGVGAEPQMIRGNTRSDDEQKKVATTTEERLQQDVQQL